MSAMSSFVSTSLTEASNLTPLFISTLILCLLVRTWALVTIQPSSDTMNPEPLETGTSWFENANLSEKTQQPIRLLSSSYQNIMESVPMKGLPKTPSQQNAELENKVLVTTLLDAYFNMLLQNALGERHITDRKIKGLQYCTCGFYLLKSSRCTTAGAILSTTSAMKLNLKRILPGSREPEGTKYRNTERKVYSCETKFMRILEVEIAYIS